LYLYLDARRAREENGPVQSSRVALRPRREPLFRPAFARAWPASETECMLCCGDRGDERAGMSAASVALSWTDGGLLAARRPTRSLLVLPRPPTASRPTEHGSQVDRNHALPPARRRGRRRARPRCVLASSHPASPDPESTLMPLASPRSVCSCRRHVPPGQPAHAQARPRHVRPTSPRRERPTATDLIAHASLLLDPQQGQALPGPCQRLPRQASEHRVRRLPPPLDQELVVAVAGLGR